jgi:hypothetical protein
MMETFCVVTVAGMSIPDILILNGVAAATVVSSRARTVKSWLRVQSICRMKVDYS